jgi:hypothetical protein
LKRSGLLRLSKKHIIPWLTLAGLLISLFFGSQVFAADEYNCLMCHRHRLAGRIDENGKRWNYNVDEAIYNHSVHRNIECRDCHSYITKIPHEPVTDVINCANQCHIKPPFAQQKFSHQKIVDLYNQSAHGITASDPEILKQAKPYCKFCHSNPLYTKISEERVSYAETLARCLNCHPESGVTQAYMHMTHRLRKRTSRSSREIVELCAKCHQDVALMKKLKVSATAQDAVTTYNQSIHGKLVRLGSEKAANCVNCHASSGLHDIYKKDDARGTIYKENLMKTCQQCHARPTEWFVGIAVHPTAKHRDSPLVFFMSIFLRLSLYGAVLTMVGLMLFETYGRRREGVKLVLKKGTSWHGQSKTGPPKEK